MSLAEEGRLISVMVFRFMTVSLPVERQYQKGDI